MRQGLPTLKDATYAHSHPLELSERSHNDVAEKMQMLQKLYGTALPARMSLEKQILSKVGRLPGLLSSRLGLESMTGSLDEFSFSSYLNLPHDVEVESEDVHAQLENEHGVFKRS